MTVYIKDLRGPNVKKALGATRVFKRYHNRNYRGGEFGIFIHFAENNRSLQYSTRKRPTWMHLTVGLTGDHDLHDVIYSLTFAPLAQIGIEIIHERNYKTMTFEDLMDVMRTLLRSNVFWND